ncbi:MAG: glycosyltransferase [Armatimonadetes bacterium]|nr:glycosyltransferase [Armatimonadota bacterium]
MAERCRTGRPTLAREQHRLAAELVLDRAAAGWDGPVLPPLDPAPLSAAISGAVAVLVGGGEPGGLAILESLACGTPVVAPGGEVFERDLGKLVLCGTPGEQAAELARLESDTEHRVKRLRGGLAATRSLTWPAMAEQTLAGWRQALGG